MTNYCRLCAELKDPDEIVASITDTVNSIEQKLTACCQWNAENTDPRLPQDVCMCCLDKLDKCWLFSKNIQLAQDKLKEIFDNEIRTDSDANVPEGYGTIELSFDCTVCFNSFSSRIALKEHECNKSTTSEQCNLCHKRFKSLDGLRYHYKKQAEYTCQICSKVFCVSGSLKKHKQQPCGNVKLKQPINESLEYDIDEIKVELPDEIDTIEDVGSIMDEDSLLVPIETNTATPSSNHTQVEHKLKATKTKKSSIKSDDSDKFDCYLCNQRFRTFLLLKRHMEIHSLPKALKCDHCNAKFRTELSLNCHKAQLKAHKTRKVNKYRKANKARKTSTASVPPKLKVKQPSNQNSENELHDDRNYQCYVCKRKFIKFAYVKSHMIVHYVPKTLKCQYCRITFRSKRYLNQHIRLHIDFSCDVCNKEFPSERTLRLHKRVHVGGSSKLYGCVQCDHFFKDLSTYCNHMKARHGIDRPDAKKIMKTIEPNGTAKPYVCEQCGKDFSSPDRLRAHALVHSDVRNHVCDICSKGFKSKYMLKSHKLVHQERKFQCDICGKAFNRKAPLFHHMELHTGIITKKYSCDFCSKTFRNSCNMKSHRRTHTGEKPYRCELCNFASGSSNELKKHFKRISHLNKLKESSELQ